MFVFPAFLAVLLLISTFIVAAFCEGNVTCSGTALDWYTSQVGETACKTYERLRQICNSDFEVGVMNYSYPPDTCDEQVCAYHFYATNFVRVITYSSLKRIAVATQLPLFNPEQHTRFSCQQNIGSGSGYDAPIGDYQLYLQGSRTNGTCSPVRNQTLPTAIQTAVCNEEIKLFDSLYSLFWADGSWYYMYTEQTISKSIASNNNNTFTHCASTTLNHTSTSSSSASATSSPSSSVSTRLSGGTVGGIVVGTIVGAVAAALMMWFCWWKRKQSRKTVKPENKIEPFTPSGAQAEAYNRQGGISTSSKPYNDSAISQGDTSIIGSPSPPQAAGPSYPSAYMGYPTGLISAYGAPSPNYPRSPSQIDSPSPLITGSLSSEKGARLYSSLNQPMSPTPTSVTTMGSMSSRPILSPSGHSYNPSLGAFTEDSEREQMSIMSSIPERHTDGGRIPDEILDGRLPPAYGEQLD
ncbi:hypothetical protein J3R30DRAFT_3702099 [Lentinula aciculospora]|uniref:Uncharacterized protein n=1 Tax=Lentinula aciculospora TaxID=153920 RepID=A0A9W9DPQ5_9AGAR|nr:hypothetical protein J3R30DRAFT_3702099 [Lentinula aciculospora]